MKKSLYACLESKEGGNFKQVMTHSIHPLFIPLPINFTSLPWSSIGTVIALHTLKITQNLASCSTLSLLSDLRR